MILNWKNVRASWTPFFIANEHLLEEIESSLSELAQTEICPPPSKIFRAMELTDVDSFKVLLISQDPYFNGEACGLAFSISPGQKMAPSLKNINKELISDLGVDNSNNSGDLEKWTEDVLLLNTSLTTITGTAGAHKKIWKKFSQELIKYISENNPFFVMLAWGRHAHSLAEIISDKHTIIKTSHPSPLGWTKSGSDFVSFRNSQCFSQANSYLEMNGIKPVKWQI